MNYSFVEKLNMLENDEKILIDVETREKPSTTTTTIIMKKKM